MGGFAHSQAQAIESEEGFHGYAASSHSSSSSAADSSDDETAAPRPPPAVVVPRRVEPLFTPRREVLPQDPDPGRRPRQATMAAAAAPSGSGSALPAQGIDLQLLRSLFPLLRGMPDNMMASTDLATLNAIHQSLVAPSPPPGQGQPAVNYVEVAAQAAAAAAAHLGLAGAGQKDEDPGVAMARSLETLRDKPVKVDAGEDDRSEKLHPARFLGGAVCSAKKLWRAARDTLGLEGIPPLANYDMTAVGLMGCVTARAWKELHNPASMNNTVKLYSPHNMSSSTSSTRRLSLADGDKSINVGESLKEIADLEELKLAVRAMCRAAQFVMPWNMSYNAIDGFLQSSDWARAELSGRSNRAVLLAEFINYVLGLNAQAWQQKEDFRSSGEVKVLWGEWFGSRPASLLTVTTAEGQGSAQQGHHAKQGGKKFDNRRGQSGGGKQHGGGGQSKQGVTVPPYPPPTHKPAGGGVQGMLFCWKYNNGSCPNAAGSCALPSGTKLNHLCDAYLATGDMCKQNHPRVQHK